MLVPINAAENRPVRTAW